ncbi:hypothetical protein AVEN_255871-1 [Araneus ventricosus]|uniref:Uncharacterized protein n=1 Tax=Araneus ventricosus TaxID=182803 RepID=A0A4Y2DFB6_ARAVE|nr:hypothetical protein AVEN_255871-1 [Araneus ventricosus]
MHPRSEDIFDCHLEVTNGTVDCAGHIDRALCKITCDGKFQGDFHCSIVDGWKEELPYCVKPKQEGTGKAVADVEALECDPAECIASCPYNPSSGQYGGICDKGQCICIKPF